MRHSLWTVAAGAVVLGCVWAGTTSVRGEPEGPKAVQVDEATLRAVIAEETQRVAGTLERRLRKVEAELADAREAVRLLAGDHARLVRAVTSGRPGEQQANEGEKRLAALGGQLATLRGQIGLYAQQHGGQLPTLAQLQADWGVLTSTTDEQGNIGRGDFGPYINTVPKNALTGKAGVAGPGVEPPASAGWVYDERNGTLWAVVPKGTPVNGKDVVFTD